MEYLKRLMYNVAYVKICIRWLLAVLVGMAVESEKTGCNISVLNSVLRLTSFIKLNSNNALKKIAVYLALP